jgi:N-methylhydantoinase A/oxoprolinase/acetone carboxylase beta subunit
VFASIANYLERRGNWRANEGWGLQVQANGAALSESFRATRPIADWRRAGVRTLSGGALAEGPPAKPVGQRNVWFDRAIGWAKAQVFDRDMLPPGQRINGPAVINEMSATTIIPPHWGAVVDPWGNLVLEPRA